MSLVQYDRVQETSTTTGTGTYTLAGAVLGYQSFAVVGNANTAYYCAMGVDGNGNPNGDGWEVGLGTYTAAGTTLARTAVLASTNANAAVNWAAGTRRIFLTIAAAGSPAILSIPSSICEGRLTTESGVPVSTTDRTAQGTLYWSPCLASGKAKTNGLLALWTGTAVTLKSITQLSLALTITSGKNKNVYIDYNAGTPQIVVGADWTNDTTESETLVDQNGLIVLSGTPAYRYVGVIRADGANTIADSGGITGTTQVGGKRFVWNAYNQVERQLKVIDTTDSWPYTVTGTIRQANGAAGNKVEYVSGDGAMLVKAKVVANLLSSNTTSVAKAGVGVDSTTAFSGLVGGGYLSIVTASTVLCPLVSFYEGQPGIGYHFLSWNEKGATSATFLGDDGADSSQSGLTATIWG